MPAAPAIWVTACIDEGLRLEVLSLRITATNNSAIGSKNDDVIPSAVLSPITASGQGHMRGRFALLQAWLMWRVIVGMGSAQKLAAGSHWLCLPGCHS